MADISFVKISNLTKEEIQDEEFIYSLKDLFCGNDKTSDSCKSDNILASKKRCQGKSSDCCKTEKTEQTVKKAERSINSSNVGQVNIKTVEETLQELLNNIYENKTTSSASKKESGQSNKKTDNQSYGLCYRFFV